MKNLNNSFLAILKHQLFASSLLMIVGSNVINLINYLYHFLMAPRLGVSAYGELATLLSLIGLLSILPMSLTLVVVKFIASSKNDEEISQLISWLGKRVLIISLVSSILIALTANVLSSFLNIQNPLLIILAAGLFFFTLPAAFYRASLQGLLKFRHYIATLIIEVAAKLVLGIIFVELGFGVLGATFGIFLASILGFAFSRAFLSKFTKASKKVQIKTLKLKPIFLYSIPIVIQTFTLTSLYSTDLILVKHYFSSYEAGVYATASILSRAIFFATAPIATVMFPMIAKSHAKGEKYLSTFALAFIGTLSITSMALIVFYFVPSLPIVALSGSQFIEAKNYLFPFGIFITLLSLSSLITSFYLSIGSTKIIWFSAIAAIAQFIGIILFHDSLYSVINVSVIVSCLLLISTLIFLLTDKSTITFNKQK